MTLINCLITDKYLKMYQLRNSLLVCFLFSFVMYAQDQIVVNPNAPEITFENDIIDMGTYMQYDDESSRVEFLFVNTGKEPLIIEKCKGSCGCTVPEWPKEPIPPGGTGSIKVNYDEKRVGPYTKSITITSNAKTSPKVIKIKGKVQKVEDNISPEKKDNSQFVPKAQ